MDRKLSYFAQNPQLLSHNYSHFPDPITIAHILFETMKPTHKENLISSLFIFRNYHKTFLAFSPARGGEIEKNISNRHLKCSLFSPMKLQGSSSHSVAVVNINRYHLNLQFADCDGGACSLVRSFICPFSSSVPQFLSSAVRH